MDDPSLIETDEGSNPLVGRVFPCGAPHNLGLSIERSDELGHVKGKMNVEPVATVNGKLTSGHRPIPTPQRVETVDDAIDVEIGAADHGGVLSLDFEKEGQTARDSVRRMCDTAGGSTAPSSPQVATHITQ